MRIPLSKAREILRSLAAPVHAQQELTRSGMNTGARPDNTAYADHVAASCYQFLIFAAALRRLPEPASTPPP